MSALSLNNTPPAELYRQLGYWTSEPVPDTLRSWAEQGPQRTALVDRKGPLSYGELHTLVRRAAAGLWALGLRPGDTLALQLPNWREFAVFQLAAVRMGLRYAPLLPQLRAADLDYLLRVTNAKAIVIPDHYRNFDHVAMLRELQTRLSGLAHVFVVGAAGAPSIAVESWLDQPWEQTHGSAVDAVRVDPNAHRFIQFTSGTEAKPKGALHSYNTGLLSLKLHQRFFDLGPDDSVLTASPIGHGTGFLFGVEFGIMLGSKTVLLEKWDPAAAIELIARERCTLMWGATTFWQDLVDAPNLARHDLSSFKLALTAGAPVVRALVTQVAQKLGATLVAAYGQSEANNISINHPDDSIERITNSDGRINPGFEFKLVDADRQPVAHGEPGEFAYRGPSVCLGYLEPEHTARSFDADGYFYSGDLVQVDAEGYLRVVGRRKDIIIRGGENISPAEIEEIIHQHPAVADVAVIGLSDARLGQRTCAVVVPRPGKSLTLPELLAFFGTRQIAKFKFPEQLAIVTELPRTAAGKVRKELLRQQLGSNDSPQG